MYMKLAEVVFWDRQVYFDKSEIYRAAIDFFLSNVISFAKSITVINLTMYRNVK